MVTEAEAQQQRGQRAKIQKQGSSDLNACEPSTESRAAGCEHLIVFALSDWVMAGLHSGPPLCPPSIPAQGSSQQLSARMQSPQSPLLLLAAVMACVLVPAPLWLCVVRLLRVQASHHPGTRLHQRRQRREKRALPMPLRWLRAILAFVYRLESPHHPAERITTREQTYRGAESHRA